MKVFKQDSLIQNKCELYFNKYFFKKSFILLYLLLFI